MDSCQSQWYQSQEPRGMARNEDIPLSWKVCVILVQWSQLSPWPLMTCPWSEAFSVVLYTEPLSASPKAWWLQFLCRTAMFPWMKPSKRDRGIFACIFCIVGMYTHHNTQAPHLHSPAERDSNPLQYLAWEIPQRSVAGYSSWGHEELDTTEPLNNNNIFPACDFKFLNQDSGSWTR